MMLEDYFVLSPAMAVLWCRVVLTQTQCYWRVRVRFLKIIFVRQEIKKRWKNDKSHSSKTKEDK